MYYNIVTWSSFVIMCLLYVILCGNRYKLINYYLKKDTPYTIPNYDIDDNFARTVMSVIIIFNIMILLKGYNKDEAIMNTIVITSLKLITIYFIVVLFKLISTIKEGINGVRFLTDNDYKSTVAFLTILGGVVSENKIKVYDSGKVYNETYEIYVDTINTTIIDSSIEIDNKLLQKIIDEEYHESNLQV